MNEVDFVLPSSTSIELSAEENMKEGGICMLLSCVNRSSKGQTWLLLWGREIGHTDPKHHHYVLRTKIGYVCNMCLSMRNQPVREVEH